MIFHITVPVKAYVKRFLENNYGNPVNFSSHPREKDFFIRMLKKPDNHDNAKYKQDYKRFPCCVTIALSESPFYRKGCELTKTDTIALGKHFERNAKMVMRTMVGTYISFGMPINAAIINFQETFKMEEEYWAFDSIKKDFFRYKISHKIDFNHYAFQHLEKLILLNMSNAGILTRAIINEIQIGTI